MGLVLNPSGLQKMCQELRRQLAGERVPGAIRSRTPDLPRFSAILLRRDWRPASRSTRGCAGHASTIWLTPNVRLTYGCRPAHSQRQLAGERVPCAIRLRTPDLQRISLILRRRD